jgi:ribose 5-phosphate isomerase B
MAANKVPGVRAAVVTDAFTAEMARRHNDAQVASFGTRVLDEERILRFAEVFLATPFDGGRHQRRVEKMAALEKGLRGG